MTDSADITDPILPLPLSSVEGRIDEQGTFIDSLNFPADSVVENKRSAEGHSIRPTVSLSASVQIAAAIARPLEAAASKSVNCGSLKPEDLHVIAQHPCFSGPLNRSFSKLSGLENLAIDITSLRRLGCSSASSFSIHLSTDAPSTVAQASRLVGAVILYKHLLARTLKHEREALQQALGSEVYQIATRETPMLYSVLSELDDGSFAIDASISTPENAESVCQRIATTGQMALRLFVNQAEPALGPLFAIRNPLLSDEVTIVSSLTDQHISHIVKLLRRRFLPWSHTID